VKRVVWDEAQRVGDWVYSKFPGSHFDPEAMTAIGQESGGQIVGGCVYECFNGRAVQMHVAGDGGHWMTMDFLRAVLQYPFLQLGVKKIIAPIDADNAQARKFVEHVGFIPEATIVDGGKRGNLILYTLARQECRYLGVPHGKKLST